MADRPPQITGQVFLHLFGSQGQHKCSPYKEKCQSFFCLKITIWYNRTINLCITNPNPCIIPTLSISSCQQCRLSPYISIQSSRCDSKTESQYYPQKGNLFNYYGVWSRLSQFKYHTQRILSLNNCVTNQSGQSYGFRSTCYSKPTEKHGLLINCYLAQTHIFFMFYIYKMFDFSTQLWRLS